MEYKKLSFKTRRQTKNINFTDMPAYYSFALPDNVSSQMALKPLCRLRDK